VSVTTRRVLSLGLRLTAAVALAGVAARPAAAQTTRPLPVYHGVFGPDEHDDRRPSSFDVNWALYSADDDNSLVGADAGQSGRPQSGGIYSGATMSATYRRQAENRGSLTISGGTAARYYGDLGQVVTTRYSGGLGLDSLVSRSWRLQLSESASYSPFYNIALAPAAAYAPAADVSVPTADDAVSRQAAMLYGSYAGLTHMFSDRTSMGFEYDARYLQVFDHGSDTSMQRGSISYLHNIAENVALRLAYGYRVATTSPDVAPIQYHDIDMGLSYGRSFAPTRRTIFAFSTGSAFASSGDGVLHLRMVGSARLTRRLSPRWTEQLLYDRGFLTPDGATRPFFADTIATNLTGYINSRMSVRLRPAFAHGVVGFTGETNAYNSVSNTARIEVAMSRHLAFYAEHFYYRYRFDNGAGLPPQLTASFDRQGARVGLTVWTPLQ
jgi:hypothetical protein